MRAEESKVDFSNTDLASAWAILGEEEERALKINLTDFMDSFSFDELLEGDRRSDSSTIEVNCDLLLLYKVDSCLQPARKPGGELSKRDSNDDDIKN